MTTAALGHRSPPPLWPAHNGFISPPPIIPFPHPRPPVMPQEPPLKPRNDVDLNRAKLIEVLNYFAECLAGPFSGRQMRMVVHGGACMLLHPGLDTLSTQYHQLNPTLPKRQSTRDVDYIHRSFITEMSQLGVPDSAEKLKGCILATARKFGLGADWMNSDADIALPMATAPNGMRYDPIYHASVQPNNIQLHTIFRSKNSVLTLISVTPFWAVALKLARYTPQDAADICLLLRNGTILSQVAWTVATLRDWLFRNCWVMGYTNYDAERLNILNLRLKHAVDMVQDWGRRPFHMAQAPVASTGPVAGSSGGAGGQSQSQDSISSVKPDHPGHVSLQAHPLSRVQSPPGPGARQPQAYHWYMPSAAESWAAVNLAPTPMHPNGRAISPLEAMGGGGEVVGGPFGKEWRTDYGSSARTSQSRAWHQSSVQPPIPSNDFAKKGNANAWGMAITQQQQAQRQEQYGAAGPSYSGSKRNSFASSRYPSASNSPSRAVFDLPVPSKAIEEGKRREKQHIEEPPPAGPTFTEKGASYYDGIINFPAPVIPEPHLSVIEDASDSRFSWRRPKKEKQDKKALKANEREREKRKKEKLRRKERARERGERERLWRASYSNIYAAGVPYADERKSRSLENTLAHDSGYQGRGKESSSQSESETDDDESDGSEATDTDTDEEPSRPDGLASRGSGAVKVEPTVSAYDYKRASGVTSPPIHWTTLDQLRNIPLESVYPGLLAASPRPPRFDHPPAISPPSPPTQARRSATHPHVAPVTTKQSRTSSMPMLTSGPMPSAATIPPVAAMLPRNSDIPPVPPVASPLPEYERMKAKAKERAKRKSFKEREDSKNSDEDDNAPFIPAIDDLIDEKDSLVLNLGGGGFQYSPQPQQGFQPYQQQQSYPPPENQRPYSMSASVPVYQQQYPPVYQQQVSQQIQQQQQHQPQLNYHSNTQQFQHAPSVYQQLRQPTSSWQQQ